MSWIKLKPVHLPGPIWVNMRTHDFMRALTDADDEPPVTRISVHDGEHVEVMETPEEIMGLIEAQRLRERRET